MKDSLIFEWPGRHHLHPLLPAALAAAALLHAGLFFLFSIVYPRQESGGVDTARVFYVVAGSPEFASLSALLKSADPAVFAPGRGLPLADVSASGDYTPQYDTAHMVLDPLPEAPAVVPGLLSAPGPVPVIGRAEARRANDTLPAVSLTATGGLAGRVPVLPPDAGLQPPAGSNPGSAVFLAAVRSDGSVAHLFPQQSSGNEELDRRSAGILRGIRFSKGSDNQAWGVVSFQWGLPSSP